MVIAVSVAGALWLARSDRVDEAGNGGAPPPERLSPGQGGSGIGPNKLPPANASAGELVAYLLDRGTSTNENAIGATIARIRALPKPEQGNRKIARKLTDEGLDLFGKGDFKGAASVLERARIADPRDVQIANDLGFAYVRAGAFPQAEKMLISTLALAPDRTPAWYNIGELYARSGVKHKAVAAYAHAYRFSANREKTMAFLVEQATGDPDIALKVAAVEALTVIKALFPVPAGLPSVPYIERTIVTPDIVTGKWRLRQAAELYSFAGIGAKSISTVPKDAVVDATELEVHTRRYQTCEFRGSRVLHLWEHLGQGDHVLPAADGDKAAIMSYYGEGECVVWFKGRTYVGFCPDSDMEPGKDLKCDRLDGKMEYDMWANVILQNGKSGWLRAPDAKGMSKHGPAWNEAEY